jgi:TonB family protein
VWDADRVIANGGLKNWADQAGQNMKIYNELWSARAAQFGQTGSPLDADSAGPARTAPSADRVGGLPTVDLDSRKQLQRELSKQFKARRQAVIEVVQDKSGKLERVRLVSPSLDENVDRQAVADVRAAAEQLPPPPDEVAGSHQKIVSVWNFELIVSISPPVPTFTFEFDEVTGVIDARLPLDRRIYKKVRLVSVKQID